MVEVTIYDKKISVPVGTRVIDLMSEEDKHNYLVCQIGAQIKELRYRLSEKNDGMKISFKGLENIEGGKAYEASLRFIIAMAFHNIYPDVRIRFSYNVSRSVFCQALTPGFNM